jgi:hypothetical protein
MDTGAVFSFRIIIDKKDIDVLSIFSVDANQY